MDDSLGGWLAKAKRAYGPLSETAGIEIAALAASVIGKSRSWVAAHPDAQLSDLMMRQLDESLTGLIGGVPLPYLTGVQEFYGLQFHINQDVLIPRPETELLVAEALAWLRRQQMPVRGLDLCTGSGCIAIAICANHGQVEFTATDISTGALAVARRNVATHNLEDRIELAVGDLAAALEGEFQLITANPPYIPTGRLASLAVTRYEPKTALDGGESGTQTISRILVEARIKLGKPSLLLCEIDETQGDSALALALEHHSSAVCTIINDLSDMPRLLRISYEE